MIDKLIDKQQHSVAQMTSQGSAVRWNRIGELESYDLASKMLQIAS